MNTSYFILRQPVLYTDPAPSSEPPNASIPDSNMPRKEYKKKNIDRTRNTKYTNFRCPP